MLYCMYLFVEGNYVVLYVFTCQRVLCCIVCIYLSKVTMLYCMYLLVKGYCVVLYVFTCQRVLCCIVCIYFSKDTVLYCIYLLVKEYYVVAYVKTVEKWQNLTLSLIFLYRAIPKPELPTLKQLLSKKKRIHFFFCCTI
jgi:hypothetical protein